MLPATAARYASLGSVRRAISDDLFRVRPSIYWLDFSVSMVISWVAFWLTLSHPSMSRGVRLLCFCVSVLGFFRALLFIHELAHLGGNKLRSFRLVWNLFCGSMFLLPEFTYAIHSFHHLTSTFSTTDDPEYVPLPYQRPFELLAPFVIFPIVPLAIMLRFLVVAPVSWIVGGSFREALLRHASSLKMNPKFQWREISAEDRRFAVRQEMGCVIWWTAFVSGALAAGRPQLLVHWYVLAYCILTVNHIRAMIAHRYGNLSGDRVTHEEQLLDSVTIAGWSPLAALLAPVGLRYHSLHHLFPTLPYHSMGKVHKRLLEILPHDHVYRRTIVPSVWAAFRAFFSSFRAHRAK